MTKKVLSLNVSQKDITILKEWSSSRTLEVRLAERANIILKCLQGKKVSQIAKELDIRPNTIIDWRRRFENEGIDGLYDRPRSGKPPVYNDDFRNKVLATLEKQPPPGQARWDGKSIAKHLNSSVDAVWRILRKEGICLVRQRSWCISTDPEFAAKAADIIGLYLVSVEKAKKESKNNKLNAF